MALAAGAQRIAIYKLRDTASDTANPEPFGLVRQDGSRRPAFTAYQVATRYLAGFQRASLDRYNDAAIVTVERNTGWTTVLWARGAADVTVQVPAHAASAQLVDGAATPDASQPATASSPITLPGSACNHPADPCLIGGAPYLLVEGNVSADAPPISQPSQGQAPTATLDPDAPTATPRPPTATPTQTPTAHIDTYRHPHAHPVAHQNALADEDQHAHRDRNDRPATPHATPHPPLPEPLHPHPPRPHRDTTGHRGAAHGGGTRRRAALSCGKRQSQRETHTHVLSPASPDASSCSSPSGCSFFR